MTVGTDLTSTAQRNIGIDTGMHRIYSLSSPVHPEIDAITSMLCSLTNCCLVRLGLVELVVTRWIDNLEAGDLVSLAYWNSEHVARLDAAEDIFSHAREGVGVEELRQMPVVLIVHRGDHLDEAVTVL